MKKANNSMMVGSSSWLEQFTEAFVVQAGKDLELTFLEKKIGSYRKMSPK